MSISSTTVVIATSGQEYSLPGNQTVEAIKTIYGAAIPGLASMTAQEVVDGDTKVVTFSQATGTKGAVSSTTVVIATSGQEYSLPGDQTVEAIKTIYGAAIPGLASMTAQEVVDGDVKIVTFSQATGTKGA